MITVDGKKSKNEKIEFKKILVRVMMMEWCRQTLQNVIFFQGGDFKFFSSLFDFVPLAFDFLLLCSFT